MSQNDEMSAFPMRLHRKEHRQNTFKQIARVLVCVAVGWFIVGGPLDDLLCNSDACRARVAKSWCQEQATECLTTACNEMEPDACLSTAFLVRNKLLDRRAWARSIVPYLP